VQHIPKVEFSVLYTFNADYPLLHGPAMLLMDQAGWHTSRMLVVPDTIMML
jgi:hypothetical protein